MLQKVENRFAMPEGKFLTWGCKTSDQIESIASGTPGYYRTNSDGTCILYLDRQNLSDGFIFYLWTCARSDYGDETSERVRELLSKLAPESARTIEEINRIVAERVTPE